MRHRLGHGLKQQVVSVHMTLGELVTSFAHVMCGAHVTLLTVNIYDVGISDHRPLW